jgi:hypothetical protein
VIIRYPNTYKLAYTSASVVDSGGFYYYVFSATGLIQF